MRDLANVQKRRLRAFYLSQVFEEPRILSRRRVFALSVEANATPNDTQLKMPGNLAVSGHFLQLWWPGTESNHRHADFQSAALPTELPGHEERKYIKGDYVAQVLFGTFLLKRSWNPRQSSLALVLAQIHTELLELAIQVRALQSRLLRHPRHAAVLARQVILEVRALEGIAGIA